MNVYLVINLTSIGFDCSENVVECFRSKENADNFCKFLNSSTFGLSNRFVVICKNLADYDWKK